MSSRPAAADAAALVRRLADDAGFGMVGIGPADISDHADTVRAWIAEGRHGEMGYLANHLHTRLDPRQLVEGARAVICVADAYPDRLPTSAERASAGGQAPRGRVARYAWGDDYHKVMKRRLHALADAMRDAFPGEQFRCTVDTAPILEREHAARAGLGWQGKNTMLIHPRHGSYFLLGCIVTTLEMRAAEPPDSNRPYAAATDHCGTCTRCIEACPTGCIEDPAETGRRAIDASRCISYLTIEHREPIAAELHEPMGRWVAGCDVCQEVCPYNDTARDAAGTGRRETGTPPASARVPLPVHPPYRPRDLARGLDLVEVLGWTAEDRQRVFRGSALKRIKLDMIRRNAVIALGNAIDPEDDESLKRLGQIAADPEEPELVRRTARQALDRLQREHASRDSGEA